MCVKRPGPGCFAESLFTVKGVVVEVVEEEGEEGEGERRPRAASEWQVGREEPTRRPHHAAAAAAP